MSKPRKPATMPKHMISMRFPPQAYATVRRMAEDQETTMTEVVLRLLEQAARSAGYDLQPLMDSGNRATV